MTVTSADLEGGGGVPPASGRLMSCLRSVASALGDVADAPCWALSDDEITEAVNLAMSVRAQVDELTMRVVAAMGTRDLARARGATSTAAWLSASQRLSRLDAGALTRLAADLDGRYEATRLALAAGEVSTEQARVVTAAVDDLPTWVPVDDRIRAEAWLLEQARVYDPDELRRLGKRVFEVIDPEAADEREGELLEAEERRARQRTRLVMRRRGDGTTRGSFVLPDLQADMLRTALEAVLSPRRWHLDRGAMSGALPTQARSEGSGASDNGIAGVGAADTGTRDPDREPETRPYPVRLGHAFGELIEHLPLDGLPQAGGVAATMTVTLDYDTLVTGIGAATLSSGTRISAGEARRLACSAGVIPAVFGGDSVCLDLRRSRRFHSRHQRVAIGIAQRGCVWPGCDRPPAWSEIHHPTPWSDNGNTDLQAAMLCPRHHHLAHQDWRIRIATDGIPEVVPPARLDPTQTPRRHRRFRRQGVDP